MKKIGALFIAAGIALILSAWSLWPERNEQSFSGTLELTEHSVGARTAGRLSHLFVGEGDSVKQGQLLATLDRYDQADRDYRRVAGLYKSGGATHQALEEAQLVLEDQEVISPINGVVLIKVHETGEVVSSGSPVLDIGDRNDMWMRIFLPENEVSRVQMDQPAVVHIDGLSQPFQGRVSFISPVAEFTPRNVQSAEERITQTFAVKARLDNPPAFLRPGVSGDVRLVLSGAVR